MRLWMFSLGMCCCAAVSYADTDTAASSTTPTEQAPVEVSKDTTVEGGNENVATEVASTIERTDSHTEERPAGGCGCNKPKF